MTREEAKQLLPVIKAYIEGKEIQYKRKFTEEEWKDALYLNETTEYTYRIKPTPTFRPFKDAGECWQEMQKHKPFGWLKDKLSGTYVNVGYVPIDNDVSSFNSLTFADGQPFGILEE